MLERINKAQTIGIIDADLIAGGTRFPNLAIMKMSAYCKDVGKDVDFIYQDDAYDKTHNYDLVLISKVFTFSPCPEDLQARDNVLIGGTGFYEDGGGKSSI